MIVVNDQHITPSVLTDEEHEVDRKIVRVWKFRNIWKFIVLIIIIAPI